MAEQKTMADLLADFRRRMEAGHKKARTRIAVTAVLMVAVVGYMSWIYSSVSLLDADAITKIARVEVQARLPEMGESLTKIALDAAPQLLDRGEEALLSAPSALRDSVETRMLEGTGQLIDQFAEQLDTQLAEAIQPRLDAVNGGSGGQNATLEQLMVELRAAYRVKAKLLMNELYLGYSQEIGGVNTFLVRLKSGTDLTPRERAQREIIKASVALRRHFIVPIEPTTLADHDNDE